MTQKNNMQNLHTSTMPIYWEFLSSCVENNENSSIFVDWITIKQIHSEDLPVINSGHFFSVARPGRLHLSQVEFDDIDFTVSKRYMHEGSYSTAISLRCDGTTVELSGNVGRFNRADNLWGFTFEEIINRCNKILSLYDLPPFTAGKSYFSQTSSKLEWTGAIITRLDVTCNYASLGQENAKKVMIWLSSQKIGRMQNKVCPDGNSVIVGRAGKNSSKYLNHTFYNKYEEFLAHSKKNKDTPELVQDYCFQMGIIRSEIKLFSRYLTQNRLRFLGEITHKRLIEHYLARENEAIKRRMKINTSTLENIPFPYRGTVLAWKDGHNLSTMSKRSFYRHRKFLIEYGIDISVPFKKVNDTTKIEVIKIVPVSPPEWYLNLHNEKVA